MVRKVRKWVRKVRKVRIKMDEVWKDVVEYEGLYQVSNNGVIKRIPHYSVTKNGVKKHFDERVLSPIENFRGYYKVSLSKNGITRQWFVHRIVAMAFLPNPNNYAQVNHKDENKKNNNPNNLEWCDNVYNCKYGNKMERQAESMRKHFAELKKEPISMLMVSEQARMLREYAQTQHGHGRVLCYRSANMLENIFADRMGEQS